MMNKLILGGAGALVATGLTTANAATENSSKNETSKPNVILIYADDLGYGDISCYGNKILKTPNMDRIASEGIRFTNGYASSSTCTPSRYAILTGQYPFRNPRARVLQGDAPALLKSNTATLPKMMKKAGYTTGIVGKWHLGLGDGKSKLDWNAYIKLNPNEVGFDYSYIMAATNDRVPTVYVENGRVANLNPKDPITVTYNWKASTEDPEFINLPTGKSNPEKLKFMWSHGHNNSITNGISRIGFMKGGTAALWVDENQAEQFLRKANDFVSKHKDEPFLLCYNLQQPHVPRIPSPRFVGKSGLGPRGDVILEADWYIGEFLETLDTLGLNENTIIIFSSDNGPVLDDGYQDQSVELNGDNTPAGVFRGGKYSVLEGGTRVPFMVRWPAKIKGGKDSDAIVSQMDIYASLAKLLGQENDAPDSMDTLDAFLGTSDKGRQQLVIDSKGLRDGDWVLLPAKMGRSWGDAIGIDSGNRKEVQLYNVTNDPAQKNNLATTYPARVKEMLKTLKKLKQK